MEIAEVLMINKIETVENSMILILLLVFGVRVNKCNLSV